MISTKNYARTSALPAIAAALALSSTPVFAQVAQPTEPAPVTETAPPPVTDATPATTDPNPATTATETAPAPSAATTTRRSTRTARTTAPRTTTATVTRTQVTRHAAAPPPPPAATQAPAPSATSESAVAPVVDLTAKPANQPAAAKPSTAMDETLPIAGGALALLALGGAAYAVSRRRRREDAWHGDWEAEPVIEHETTAETPAAVEPRHDSVVHDQQPQTVEPSAFAWGPTAPVQDADRHPDDDRLPGETWVQRAYRGPSANNPSVSLKARLRRAAFFDKRERDVAAGIAQPVDADAGLPDAMTDEQERELA